MKSLRCDYRAALAVSGDSGKLGPMEFAGGRILAYDKTNRTPVMRHINCGLGAFQRAAFDDVAAGQATWPRVARAYCVAAWESPERFYEIGSIEGTEGVGSF